MQIAIDGPAAAGKTTVGRALAHHFGCLFVETGKMYRAVALGLTRGLPLEAISLAVSEDGRLALNGEENLIDLEAGRFRHDPMIARPERPARCR